MHVSASHELLSVFREYERTSTTVIDAYLSPLLRGYLERLAAAAARGRPAGAGDHALERRPDERRARPAATPPGRCCPDRPPARSAPRTPARCPGSDDVLSFDMGGTSCDVAVIDDGAVRQTSRAGDRRAGALQLPMVDVHTVGAGGGSIALGRRRRRAARRPAVRGRRARAGLLRARRRRSRPSPTPTCCSATSAPDAPLAGGVRLDPAPPSARSRTLGRRARAGRRGDRGGIVRVADEEMLRALRVVTVERGIDPRGYALVAFGGAGPDARRAARRAARHRAGALPARRRRAVRARARDGRPPPRRRAQRAAERGATIADGRARAMPSRELAGEAARAGCPSRASRPTTTCATRARPSSWRSSRRPDAGVASCASASSRRTQSATATPTRDGELELVNVRVAAIERRRTRRRRRRRRRSAAAQRQPPRALRRRAARDRGAAGPPAPGERVAGPAVCELPEATVVVPPGWARPRRRRTAPARRWSARVSAQPRPRHAAGAGRRLRAVCEEMGAVLVRAAHSANIKERRDASTALFDCGRRRW